MDYPIFYYSYSFINLFISVASVVMSRFPFLTSVICIFYFFVNFAKGSLIWFTSSENWLCVHWLFLLFFDCLSLIDHKLLFTCEYSALGTQAHTTDEQPALGEWRVNVLLLFYCFLQNVIISIVLHRMGVNYTGGFRLTIIAFLTYSIANSTYL